MSLQLSSSDDTKCRKFPWYGWNTEGHCKCSDRSVSQGADLMAKTGSTGIGTHCTIGARASIGMILEQLLWPSVFRLFVQRATKSSRTTSARSAWRNVAEEVCVSKASMVEQRTGESNTLTAMEKILNSFCEVAFGVAVLMACVQI